MGETKRFTLRTVLTVTTGRLLTEPKDGGNGIGDLYEILGWMTDDEPFTHQLPRFAAECKPRLLEWFPELAPAEACVGNLAEWVAKAPSDPQEGIKMWLAELRLMFPEIKDVYDVPRIQAPKDHVKRNPISELVEMVGAEKVVVVATSRPRTEDPRADAPREVDRSQQQSRPVQRTKIDIES